MLTIAEGRQFLRRAQAVGLLYPIADADEQTERVRMWTAALNAEGASLDEASAVLVSIASRTGEDRVPPGRLQPGHVLEAILARRREDRALPAACQACDGRGLVIVERAGVEYARHCLCTTKAGGDTPKRIGFRASAELADPDTPEAASAVEAVRVRAAAGSAPRSVPPPAREVALTDARRAELARQAREILEADR